jgi:hypothetical protein
MKATSFRDSVAKTVRMLTRDQVQVCFRGFKPHVVAVKGKVVRMVLPEINDNAPEALIEAMQGYLDHECGHIFFTPFLRTEEELNGLGRGARKLKGQFLNIVEDIRLEKLLPRELPGTKDNLERMYEAVMDDYFGVHIQKAIAAGASPAKMMGVCIVVGFRALAGQKAFMNYMDTHNLWPHMTPLTSRMPTLAKDLQSMETYDDVIAIVDMVLKAMSPQQRAAAEKAAEEAPDDPEIQGSGGDQEPEDDQEQEENQQSEGKGKQEKDDTDAEEEGDEPDSGDAGDDEGNSSEGDDADDGDGGEEESDDKGGGEGHGDGEGTDDGSEEEGGDSSSDEQGGDDTGGGDEGDQDEPTSGGDEGNDNPTITDALKKLDPTQRKVIYLHKKKRQSIEQIAQKTGLDENAVKATLRDARRNLAKYMGSAA